MHNFAEAVWVIGAVAVVALTTFAAGFATVTLLYWLVR